MALPSDLHPTHSERVQRHHVRACDGADRGDGRTSSHSDLDISKAARINTLYLHTKAHMLQIMHDGLQLRLELCALNQQLSEILSTVDSTCSQQPLLHRLPLSDQPDVLLQPLGSQGVRALYDMRRARLLRRRNSRYENVVTLTQHSDITARQSQHNCDDADNNCRHCSLVLTSTPHAKDNRQTSSTGDERWGGRQSSRRRPRKREHRHCPSQECDVQDCAAVESSSAMGSLLLSDNSLTLDRRGHEVCGDGEKMVDVDNSTLTVTLQDISAISVESGVFGGGVLHEQLSVNSFDWQSTSSAAECKHLGMLHSTFSYPLHSTRSRLVSAARLPPPPASFASSSTDNDVVLINEQSSCTPRSLPYQQRLQPVLCKEHGLHPTFGGPCIFASSDDDAVVLDTTLSLSSSDGVTNNTADIDNANPVTPPSTGARDRDDDNDEDADKCVTCDDDEMRTLRRQTGQVHLTSPVRLSIGLSVADLLASRSDGCEHNTSTEVICSSTTTNLSANFSTSSSPESAAAAALDATAVNLAESATETVEPTLLASPAPIEGVEVADKTLLSALSCEFSVATLHDSPESTTTTSGSGGRNIQVPVNSPNATDSGGSSSQQNTEDPYDYVEVPVPKVARVMHHPPAPPPVRRHRQQRAVHSAPSAAGSGRAHSPVDSAASHWSAQLPLHDGDSGFSTHSGSWRRSVVNRRHNERVVIGCELPLNQPALSNPTGPVVQPSPSQPVGSKLSVERQKTIVRKLKKFTNNFYRVNSSGELKIRTLGHF